jgi:hypothetical protein
MWAFFVCLIVFLFFTGLATVSGYKTKEAWDKWHKPPVPEVTKKGQVNTADDNGSKIEDTKKIIEIKINRILEDAQQWLPKQKEHFLSESNRITSDAVQRGAGHSGSHVKLHIKNVNNFIETIDIYLKTVDRNIQDLLLNIGEDSIEKANDFEEQYQELVCFKESAEEAINWAKKQNYATCLKFTDKPTLDNIFKSKRYVR